MKIGVGSSLKGNFLLNCFKINKKEFTFAIAFNESVLMSNRSQNKSGTLAQLVEHRTENPGVPSSILGGTTKAPIGAFVFSPTSVFISFLSYFYS